MSLWFFIIGLCFGQTPMQSEIVTVLEEQLAENKARLHLTNAPEVYHLRYHFYDMEQYDATAAMGALLEESTDPYQYLGVEVRVGDHSFDNTGFGGWENGFTGAWLPEGVTPHAASLAAWRETDRAYKQAVEQYARKRAQFVAPEDYPGDYTELAPIQAELGRGKSSDASILRARAQHLSNALSGDPRIHRGEVHIGQESGTHWILDSTGTRISRPVQEATLSAVIHVRTTDGMLLTDHRLWSAPNTEALPPEEDMVQEVRHMRDHLLSLADKPSVSNEYVGPVLFEGDAATDVFRFLLLPQMEGTPPEIPFDSFLGDIGSRGNGKARLGRRVLPTGWTVVDDPQGNPNHPSAFAYDSEGSPSVTVQSIEDGILRVPMMSRVPRKDLRETNGHARGIERSRLNGRVAQVSISAPHTASSKKLHKKARRIAESYGRTGYYLVTKLQENAARSLGGMPSFSSGEDGTVRLPIPVSVYWVDHTGTRTELRGARFTGVQRWVLRDIVSAGKMTSRTFMIPSSPGGGLYSPTQGLPTLIHAPSILVGEMELVPAPGDPKSVPVLPHPLSEADSDTNTP